MLSAGGPGKGSIGISPSLRTGWLIPGCIIIRNSVMAPEYPHSLIPSNILSLVPFLQCHFRTSSGFIRKTLRHDDVKCALTSRHNGAKCSPRFTLRTVIYRRGSRTGSRRVLNVRLGCSIRSCRILFSRIAVQTDVPLCPSIHYSREGPISHFLALPCALILCIYIGIFFRYQGTKI